jgi:transcriptional regulator with XRE-family HTH domain
MLTPAAAAELGCMLRFVRNASGSTLRDVATRAGLSPQYVQNLEKGERSSGSEAAYLALAAGYPLDPATMRDLLLKAQLESALERHGVDRETIDFVWAGVQGRLLERGTSLRSDPVQIVAEVLGQRSLSVGPQKHS